MKGWSGDSGGLVMRKACSCLVLLRVVVNEDHEEDRITSKDLSMCNFALISGFIRQLQANRFFFSFLFLPNQWREFATTETKKTRATN